MTRPVETRPVDRRRLSPLLVVVILSLLGATTSASAARPATRSERAQLVSAIHHYHRGIAQPGRVHVSSIRISTKGPWARLNLVLPLPSGGKDRAFAVAHRVNGHWKIKAVGSAGLGCGLPIRIAKDLHLGTTCY